MKNQRLSVLANRRTRVLVGLLLAALFCIQCTSSQAVRRTDLVRAIDGNLIGANSPEVMEKVKALAATDHIALLEYCLANYENRFSDYRCTFIKQERIGGKLAPAPQEIAVKFMESPYSVAMKWEKEPPMADRILYVEGQYDNQMLVRPTNAFLRQLVGGSVLRQPDGADAMKSTLRPVNLFGFRRAMESLLGVYREAREAGDLRMESDGFAEVAGRETVVLVRTLSPARDYPAGTTKIYIDLEYLVPIALASYNWDGELISEYIYKDVKFNVGLVKDDFRPEPNELTPPKQ